MPFSQSQSRRKFLQHSAAGTAAAGILASIDDGELSAAQAVGGSRQATGVKVGEVTTNSAIVWMRVTQNATHNAKGILYRKRTDYVPKNVQIADLRGACPGAPGMVRFRYGTAENLNGAKATSWTEVTAKTDFAHQFRLTGLKPNTTYYYSAETAARGGNPTHAPLRGRFRTAAPANEYTDVTFTTITGTAYRDLDDPNGFHIYPAMLKLQPQFYVHTGDNVYYDSDPPICNSVDVCRYHWHRMHGMPRVAAFHQQVATAFEKDDHDCYHDDCWPARNKIKKMLPLTFSEAQAVFREQNPMGDLTYRTFRWGKGVQVWLVEGRDYRSPNTMKDGPTKTIWGAAQKKWLFDGLLKSDADFKVLISPTPIVGPDRKNKRDNHANAAFQHEGDEVRSFVQKHLRDRFIVCCGDRHWQYHSDHPKTGMHEFSCGPGSDQHSGGSPGLNKDYHRFHRVRGGFLSVAFTRPGNQSLLTMWLHDVHGKVVYQYRIKG